ncbi:hypothetical protein BD311DRAFT_790301 [Dichomitus squalens]|uniref:Uncharacterized protein n=1 Tax=Dichomitus squalens TaxID=114155 RepID=A0A4Q9ME31_9APHY|nr:hypothetical protein BD311DRAFT_790301 [Dichomitus squalens]
MQSHVVFAYRSGVRSSATSFAPLSYTGDGFLLCHSPSLLTQWAACELRSRERCYNWRRYFCIADVAVPPLALTTSYRMLASSPTSLRRTCLAFALPADLPARWALLPAELSAGATLTHAGAGVRTDNPTAATLPMILIFLGRRSASRTRLRVMVNIEDETPSPAAPLNPLCLPRLRKLTSGKANLNPDRWTHVLLFDLNVALDIDQDLSILSRSVLLLPSNLPTHPALPSITLTISPPTLRCCLHCYVGDALPLDLSP